MKAVKEIGIYLIEKRNVRTIDVVQYDTGIQLVFNVKDFEIPTGTTATLYVQKPSGKFVYQEDGITVATNTITIDLENQAITEHGKVPYQVSLKNGSDEITSFTGLMMVQASLKDAGSTESTPGVRAFDEAVTERVAQFRSQAETIAAAVIATIPEDYTAMEAKVNELANAIKGHLTGYIVAADDVSPVEHEVDVWVHGKNIFNGSLQKGYYWDRKDNLVDTSSGVYRSFETFLKKGVYTLSTSIKICVVRHYVDGTMLYPLHYGTSYTFTVKNDGVVAFSFREATSANWDNSVEVQLESGSVATEHAAYIDTVGAKVKRCGKNLLPNNGESYSLNGLTITTLEDGSVRMSGTATATTTHIFTWKADVINGQRYILSGCPSGGKTGQTYVLRCYNSLGDETVRDDEGNGVEFLFTNAHGNYNFAILVISGVTLDTVFKPMLRLADVEDDTYEPYNGTEYIPASDGTVEGITSLSPNMTILTDTEGVIVECEYNKDTNKVIAKICDALGIEV